MKTEYIYIHSDFFGKNYRTRAKVKGKELHIYIEKKEQPQKHGITDEHNLEGLIEAKEKENEHKKS